MNSNEINQSLESGGNVGLVLHAASFGSGIRLKKIVELCKKSPDAAGLHSPRYLQENPSYVREQKIIQSKPYLISVSTLSDAPEIMDLIVFYCADLNEVDLFLQQFNESISNLHHLSEAESSL